MTATLRYMAKYIGKSEAVSPQRDARFFASRALIANANQFEIVREIVSTQATRRCCSITPKVSPSRTCSFRASARGATMPPSLRSWRSFCGARAAE